MWDRVTFIQVIWPRKEGLRRSWERDTGKSKTPSMPLKIGIRTRVLSGKFVFINN